ncbi:Histidine--tRNA ligase, cytoplasmic [Dichanthelium oligosanthes]|uniref:histidine--tRNA ligase n=1 Tax=Dichanthelium oligosanthes TaxID=888268 RepID=A0A1E5UMF7_9POAL|nr:Histidine--tRNA ligase, cytoplasmic [Dichanthelium oligosanthes]
MASSAAATVTLGGKGAALSPAAVYALSIGLASPAIDASAQKPLSNRAPSPQETPASLGAVAQAALAPAESRAAAAVLLNKLLLTASDSASALVTAATAARLAESLDVAAALPLGSRDEAAVAAASAPVSVALAALIDCCATPLARVADAVAALSCEAARGDAAAFDVPASGDGLSAKDEADVAADIKMLVFGSKLVGSAGADPAAGTFAKVPTVNGIFREAVRALHARVRIELNAPVKLGKRDARETGEGKEEALVVLATQLARAVQALCKLSIARARLCAESIADAELRDKLTTGGVSVDDLKGMLDTVLIDSDSVSVLKGVYNHLLKFRDFLAWEAAVAMAVIEGDSSIEKPQAGVENETGSSAEKPQAAGEKWKGEKKSKKKKTLGKGTSTVLMLFRDHVANGSGVASVNSALVAEWGTSLSLLFDPKCPGLESLVEKVKEIVESNEVRRLPKIPKGTRDFGKEQMAIRERAFSIITGVFKMHGATALDTPVFELRETLMGKYGEDSKLVYDLADQVDEKGISNETADQIGDLVKTRGPPLEILLELRKEGSKFMQNEGSVVALNELEILFKALEKANALDRIVFDLSLARGLDYYTGVIYEAVFKGATQVGSIAAGGRYDNLVGMFSGKQIPAVGVSLGIERVFAIMEQQEKERNELIRTTETEVLVSILGKDLTLAAELVSELWSAGIKAEFKLTTRVMNHIKYAEKSGIPWMVLVGESEMQKGSVKLKDVKANQEEEVDRKEFVQKLKNRLS